MSRDSAEILSVTPPVVLSKSVKSEATRIAYQVVVQAGIFDHIELRYYLVRK